MTSATRFRKKPVTVDAIRNEGEWAPVLAWLDAAGYTVPFLGMPAITRNADGSLSIKTLEGVMRADVGDWVIRGIKGEFYPCKPDVFAATYEAAVEDDPATRLLALPLPENPSGASTVRGYLAALLAAFWGAGEEGLDGKRPFGDSGWRAVDLYLPMTRAGFVEPGDTESADALILAAIAKLGEVTP